MPLSPAWHLSACMRPQLTAAQSSSCRLNLSMRSKCRRSRWIHPVGHFQGPGFCEQIRPSWCLETENVRDPWKVSEFATVAQEGVTE